MNAEKNKKNKQIKNLKNEIASLSNVDKRLIKLYVQLPVEELSKKIEQFSNSASRSTNDKLNEYVKQTQLYAMALIAREHKVPIEGGKRKTRKAKQKKRKATRKH